MAIELKMKILCEKIDNLRNSLHKMLCNKKLTDKSVIKCSQELDTLLTEYELYKKSLSPRDAA